MNGRHDYRSLDPLLASRIRLAAATLLATVDAADFTFLRSQTGASEGNLGAHILKLVEAGYVAEEKSFRGRRPQTQYRLTPAGRIALEQYLERLRDMLGGSAP